MFCDFVYAPSESATRITPLHIFILELVVSLSLLYFRYFDYVGAHPLVRDALAEMSEAHSYVLAPPRTQRARKHSLEKKLIFRIENSFTSLTFLFDFIFLF
jgi:hypothetical protein